MSESPGTPFKNGFTAVHRDDLRVHPSSKPFCRLINCYFCIWHSPRQLESSSKTGDAASQNSNALRMWIHLAARYVGVIIEPALQLFEGLPSERVQTCSCKMCSVPLLEP